MPDLIIYVDESEIREGTFDELRAAMSELASFVEVNVPGIVAYTVYFDADRARMTVVHIHKSSASLEAHMRVAGPKFPPIGEFITLKSIDVYGQPDQTLVDQLEAKARMLGSGKVRVHDLHAGFARIDAV